MLIGSGKTIVVAARINMKLVVQRSKVDTSSTDQHLWLNAPCV